jgi:hypothetical protein
MDILKNNKIFNCFILLLKLFLKIENFLKSQDIICDIVKSLGLLQ